MLGIIGIVVTFAMVFGGYIAAGGKMSIILHSLPFEMMMIGGAAVGAFLLGNKGDVVKGALKGMGKAFKGPKWKAQDYKDLLLLMFGILKLVRTKGMIVLEQHIENPEQSSIFQQYPKIMHDHFAVEFICDTLRMMTMNFDDPHQVEDVMEKQLEKQEGDRKPVGEPRGDGSAEERPEIDLGQGVARPDDEAAGDGAGDRGESADDEHRQRLQHHEGQ